MILMRSDKKTSYTKSCNLYFLLKNSEQEQTGKWENVYFFSKKPILQPEK